MCIPTRMGLSSIVQYCGRMQNAICGSLLGLILFLASFPLLWWNEQNYVCVAADVEELTHALTHAPIHTQSALERHGALGGAAVNQPVYLSGELSGCRLEDATYGVVTTGLRLERAAERFLVREVQSTHAHADKSRDTTYSYESVWSSTDIESTRFADPARRGVNSVGGGWPVDSRVWMCENVRVHPHAGLYVDSGNGLRLPRSVVAALGTSQPLDVLDPAVSALGVLRQSNEQQAIAAPRGRFSDADGSVAIVRPEVERALARVRVADNSLYTGDPTRPRVGDMRFRYATTPAGPASFVGVPTAGGDLIPFVTKRGTQLLLHSTGVAPQEALLQAAHDANALQTLLLRGAGWLLMFIALMMIMNPLSVAPELLPVIGDLIASVTSCGICIIAALFSAGFSIATIAIAWLAARPMVAVVMLAVAVGTMFVARRAMQRLSRSGAADKEKAS